MGDAVRSGSHIKSVGIGEKGSCFVFFNRLDNFSDKYRANISSIALFPKMDLYGGQIVFFLNIFKTCPSNKP
jgi:hypothetical protein